MLQDTEKITKVLLVKELVNMWFDNIENIMKPSSYARYQRYADKYILPYIGEMRVDNFNKDCLSSMLSIIRTGNDKENPVSQHTVYVLEGMVHSIFRYGAEKKIVPEVLFGKAEYIITNKKEAIPLSILEVDQLLYVVGKQESDRQLQVMLPLYAGLSLSELCGLKWEDIDLEAGRIYVHRNLMRIQQKMEIKGNKTATIMTESELSKNESRNFVIPDKLLMLLRNVAEKKRVSQHEYVAEINKKMSKWNKSITKNKEPSKKVLPPDGRTLQYRLKIIGKQAGLPALTFQMLRDTFIVSCLQAGGDVYSVAYLLGVNVSAICDRCRSWLVKKDSFLKEIR